MANLYPSIFVHGLLGFGPGELGRLDYWGTAFKVDTPMPRHQASVGPLSSAHDRACEVAAQIKGTQVDYGQQHADDAGHQRFGYDYTDRAFVPNWDADHPVHLIGHSLGAPTIRCLQHLLKEDFWGWGSSHRWVHSISTLSGVTNGSPLVYFFGADETTGLMDKKDLGGKLLDLVKLYHAASSDLDTFYDFDLDHWGFNRQKGEALDAFLNRVAASRFLWEQDNAAYTLSLQGAYADNAVWKTYPDTYYVSYVTEQTSRNWFTGKHYPSPTMTVWLWHSAFYIGHKHFDHPPVPVGDFKASDWWENDGLVSTFSQLFPRTNGIHPVGGEVDATTPDAHLQPGRWFYQWERGMDHVDICIDPPWYQKRRLEAFYRRLFERLAALPLARPAAVSPPLETV